MAAKPHMQACEVRQTQYSKHWQTEVFAAAGDDPCYCCYAFWCSCCASYSLRKRAIGGDMSRYICCAGYMPCSGRCGESKCPSCCLCAETFFCFAQSVMGTRWMLQDQMQIQNTKCDNCLIGTMVALQYVSCIFSVSNGSRLIVPFSSPAAATRKLPTIPPSPPPRPPRPPPPPPPLSTGLAQSRLLPPCRSWR